jgi:hypothetical protein
MRHLGSIVLSPVLAAIVYIAAGVGMVKLSMNSVVVASGRDTDWQDIGIGVAVLVLAGAVYALLSLIRWSPLGPFLAAICYVGITAWAAIDPDGVVDLLGNSVFGVPGAAEAPLTGLALLLAMPLFATIFSPRRWRGRDKVATAGAYSNPYTPPTYPKPDSAAPAYSPFGGTPSSSASPVSPTPSSAPSSPAFGASPSYGATPGFGSPSPFDADRTVAQPFGARDDTTVVDPPGGRDPFRPNG